MCELIEQVNNVLWGYVLIAALVTCGLWFTWKTRFAQFRMIGEMLRLLTDSATSGTSGLQDKLYREGFTQALDGLPLCYCHFGKVYIPPARRLPRSEASWY